MGGCLPSQRVQALHRTTTPQRKATRCRKARRLERGWRSRWRAISEVWRRRVDAASLAVGHQGVVMDETQPSDDPARDVNEFILMLRENGLLPRDEHAAS